MSVDPVTLGIKVGLTALSMGLQMMNKIEGPRLDTLDVTLADYGTPIRRFWGIRRLEGCPIIWAEKLREEKVESKGKGGKYENYKYYGTWAVLLADHQIDSVRRLWMDKHLVFQVKGVGPVGPIIGLTENFLGLPQKLTRRNFRVYLGTEDQEPDPRMESWCEDRYGNDSCPAYRGCSYIVFQDIPLEKFGNRIPQISVEAVSQSTGAHPVEVFNDSLTGGSLLNGLTFSPDFTKVVGGNSSFFSVWDVPTRTKLTEGSPAGAFFSGINRVGLYSDGHFVTCSGNDLFHFSPDSSGYTIEVDALPIPQNECWVMRDGNGVEHLCTVNTGAVPFYHFTVGGQEADPIAATGVAWSPTCYVSDSYGDIWGIGCAFGPGATPDTVYFYRVLGSNRPYLGGSFFSVEMPVTGSNTSAVFACHSDGQFMVSWEGDFYIIDDEAFTITDSAPGTGGNAVPAAMANHQSGNPNIWLGTTEWRIADLTPLRTVTLGDWSSQTYGSSIYDPVNHAIIALTTDGKTVWAYLDRVTSDGVALQTIVEDVAGWCDIVVDAVTLDQPVYGYSVVQGTGKDMLSPLLDIHDTDCRPHDFTIQFVKRGGAATETIETANFVREGDEARYSVSIQQDTDLPRRLSVNFADEGKDQQTNTVISQRPLDSVDGVREQSIDLTTYVTTPAEAQQLSDRRFRRLWNEREVITNALTMQHLGLEPADIVTLSLDGVERNARLEKLTISQGRLKCEWKRDALTLAGLNSSQGANMDGRDEEVIYIPGPAKGIVLETPYLSDSEVNSAPLLHYAGGTYGANFNFPGVIFYETDADNNEYSEWNAVDSASRATWGMVDGALNACDPWCWDRGSSLSINTYGRTLTSVTEAEIDADPSLNLAMIGNEAVNFVTATLETDGTYTVSGFKRGRRGTEWACADHATGETFVLVSSLQTDGYSLSDVGLARTYKAQMLGRDPTYAPTTAITLSGATLKPYAPARVKKVYDGTDWTLTVTRRTRLGGSWVGGTTIPLSEASEAYEIDVMDGDDVVRTITLTGTNVATYTAAQMTTDFGSAQTSLSLVAYQLSDAVGRGFPLAA